MPHSSPWEDPSNAEREQTFTSQVNVSRLSDEIEVKEFQSDDVTKMIFLKYLWVLFNCLEQPT